MAKNDIKLNICNYFDELINNIDIITEENFLKNNSEHDNSNLNELRLTYINEIEFIKKYNIDAMKLKDLPQSELFRKFCFILKYKGNTNIELLLPKKKELWYKLGQLVITNWYLENEDIQLIK